jgi:hypothetical protein
MDANAANHIVTIHHRYALAEFGGGDGALLPSRAAAYDDEVILNRLHRSSSAWFTQSVSKQRNATSCLEFHENNARPVYWSARAETILVSGALAFTGNLFYN